jgi:hypothetical protein
MEQKAHQGCQMCGRARWSGSSPCSAYSNATSKMTRTVLQHLPGCQKSPDLRMSLLVGSASNCALDTCYSHERGTTDGAQPLHLHSLCPPSDHDGGTSLGGIKC